MINRLSLVVWRMGYTLEEARQYHAATGNLWRQAGCCVVLSMIRFMGGGI
jgi:hypothetical protein